MTTQCSHYMSAVKIICKH